MKNFCYFTMLFVLICGVCQATLTPVSPATSWTAGVDSLNTFYGADYSTANGYAELIVANDADIAAGRRAIIWATDIPAVGTYSYSLDNMISNYYTQYSYWMAYLLNDGAQFSLVGGPSGSYVPSGGVKIHSGYAPVENTNGSWHSYEYTFDVTALQANDYDYVAFVMVGSEKTGQVLAYDNFTTTVPEPSTIAVLGLGMLSFLLMPRKKTV